MASISPLIASVLRFDNDTKAALQCSFKVAMECYGTDDEMAVLKDPAGLYAKVHHLRWANVLLSDINTIVTALPKAVQREIGDKACRYIFQFPQFADDDYDYEDGRSRSYADDPYTSLDKANRDLNEMQYRMGQQEQAAARAEKRFLRIIDVLLTAVEDADRRKLIKSILDICM